MILLAVLCSQRAAFCSTVRTEGPNEPAFLPRVLQPLPLTYTLLLCIEWLLWQVPPATAHAVLHQDKAHPQLAE